MNYRHFIAVPIQASSYYIAAMLTYRKEATRGSNIDNRAAFYDARSKIIRMFILVYIW